MEKRNSNIWTLPNAIQIITYSQKLSFSSFFNRNEVYDLLKDCWHAVRKRKVCNNNYLFITKSKNKGNFVLL